MFLIILAVLVTFKTINWDSLIGLKNGPRSAQAGPGKDDWNRDGVVDWQDIQFFSTELLGLTGENDWETFDWCSWLDGNSRERKHMGRILEAYIREYFACDGEPPEPPEDPLAVKNANKYPARLAWGPGDSLLYVSDPKVGSVFIYEPLLDLDGILSGFTVFGELKGLKKPLGVAVDSQGYLYVGNNGRDNVEVYDPNGTRVMTFGQGLIEMPNDLAVDAAGRVYVADSRKNVVWLFGANGGPIRSIGDGQLDFPVAVEVVSSIDPLTGEPVGELYVADQKSFLIKVFDLQGVFLSQRSFGGEAQHEGGGMWGGKEWVWEGRFVKIQGLAMDSQNRLHAVDCFLSRGQIFDPLDGAFLGFYGDYGTLPGQLRLPLGIAISSSDEIVIANTENGVLEIYTIP